MGHRVEKISIRGFKSIRELDGLELKNLNVLIGANGAGKSNFVGFFALLSALVRKRLALTVNKMGGADAVLHLGPKVTKQLGADIQFGQNGYMFALEPTADNRLVFGTELAVYYRAPGDGRSVSLGTGHDESRLETAKDRPGVTGPVGPASYVYDSVSDWTVYHVHDTSDAAAVRRKGTVRDHQRLLPDAGNLAAYLLWLSQQHPESYALIRSAVRLVAPFFDDFLLRPRKEGQDEVVELEWRQVGTDYPFHPSQLSDGTLRFICLATALLQPHPPATVLIDEPELGLHPQALEILASLLRRASGRTQVIVSTQSPTLLSHLDPADVIVVDRADGQSTFSRLDSSALAQWLEQYTLGELWQKNYLRGGPVHE